METLTKKAKEKMLKELITFCKENWIIMWRFMTIVKDVKKECLEELK